MRDWLASLSRQQSFGARRRRRSARISILSAGVAWIAAVSGAHADEWRTRAALYGHFAGFSGEAAIGGREADIHASFSDLADHIDVGGAMALRNEKDRWAISANAVFVGMEGDVTRPAGRVDLDFNQDLIEVIWSWRLDETYELYGGGRYLSLSTQIEALAPDGTRAEDFSVQSWLDPIVGARADWTLGESWAVIAAFDVGGFGIGSDLTWSALAALDWSIGTHAGILVGYRAIDMDYEEGSGASRFRFDVLIAGPMLGVRFDFGA